jgi:hypothetical protein
VSQDSLKPLALGEEVGVSSLVAGFKTSGGALHLVG